MSQEINLKNHLMLTSTNDVMDICRPLFKQTQLNSFVYVRLYSDGYRFCLNSNAEWIKHYYQQKYYNLGKCERHPSCYKNCYVIWDAWDFDCVSYTVVGKDAESNFNLWHGLTIIKSYRDYCDFFSFTTSHNNHYINNFYVNNIDYL